MHNYIFIYPTTLLAWAACWGFLGKGDVAITCLQLEVETWLGTPSTLMGAAIINMNFYLLITMNFH